MKSHVITFLLILLLFIIAYFTVWQLRDQLLEYTFDYKNNNPTITTKKQIDDVFKSLETKSYNSLDSEYLKYTKSDEDKYKSLLQNLTYFKLYRNDLNKKIVDEYRLKDFICKDDYYIDCVMNREPSLVCILNKKLMYKTLELVNELEKGGYNKYGFKIINGHRHPRYNEGIGGAKLSRHIKGEAVDLYVGDINKDGHSDKTDKDIILDLLERKIIRDEGGIGLYPGTGNVHYDVRGKRARWDSY